MDTIKLVNFVPQDLKSLSNYLEVVTPFATLEKIQHEYLEDNPRLGYNLSGFLTNISPTSNLYIGNHKLIFNNGYEDDLMVDICPELDSSSSICINEFSSLSILSSSSSALSVEKSGNKKRKISNYFAHSVPLSKQDKEHWEKLVLNSTIDNDWSFRWVDKKSSQILFNFASPGLRLPSCKILAGHILTSNSKQFN
ncbi:11522_t:CDS:2 [Entrophospora sp. SA101]|nr:11522_t:CDS:2 [Entrophospora sp. SA101]